MGGGEVGFGEAGRDGLWGGTTAREPSNGEHVVFSLDGNELKTDHNVVSSACARWTCDLPYHGSVRDRERILVEQQGCISTGDGEALKVERNGVDGDVKWNSLCIDVLYCDTTTKSCACSEQSVDHIEVNN